MDQRENSDRLSNSQDSGSQEQVVSELDDQRTIQRDPARQEPLLMARDAGGNVHQVAAICGLLVLAVGLVFGQTVHFQFISLDDSVVVYLNPHITGGLTTEGVKWALTHSCGATYTPATWITHMLDCQIYGLNAGGHHLTNVLLHAATTVLLFLVLRQMTGRLWPSAFVAAIFAVHPLRVESVAWVIERKDVLSGLFFVLVLGAYLGYVRHRFSFARYLLVMVLFALGLMAKPMLVTAPFVLLLLDYWPLRRLTPGAIVRRVLEKLPLLALAIVFCLVAIWCNDNQGITNLLDQRFSLWWRLGNVPISYASYLGMLFYPVDLALPYPRPGFDLSFWKVLGAVLVLVVLTTAALLERRRRPYLLVGWLWYVGMLAPVSGFVVFEMHGTTMIADRFTYLPQIGLCIALTWGLADTLRTAPFRRSVCGVVAALVLAVLMGCAWRQTSFWRDNETLWKHTLACTSRNRMAHHALGNAFLERGQIDKAIEHYEAAIAIDPNYSTIHYNLGVALASVGRLDLAIEEYEKAVQLQPNDPAAQNNFGQALLYRGQFESGLSHCQEALKIDPEFAEAHYNVGKVLYFRDGHVDEAIAEYRKALKTKPELVEAHYYLGLALADRGQCEDAIAEYRKALALKMEPAFAADVHNRLGLALAACGQRDEAVEQYQKALAINPDLVDARNNLSNALADKSRGSTEEQGHEEMR